MSDTFEAGAGEVSTGEAAAGAPTVSVGMPVYNGETYLEVAISSVLAQSFDDLELIICDNASTDRTAEICQDYAAQGSPDPLFPQPAEPRRRPELQPRAESRPRPLLQVARAR